MHAIHSSIGRDIHLRVANEFRDYRLAASTRVLLSLGRIKAAARKIDAEDIALSRGSPFCGKDPTEQIFITYCETVEGINN